jgi:hypothetical protein
VEQVQTNYRMSGIATSATAGTTLNYSVPRSDYEVASNTMVSSIAFDPAASSENLQMVVSETVSKLFDMDVEDTGDGSFNDTSMNSISNALKMRLDCTASGVSDQTVYFQIPHHESQYFGVDEAFVEVNFTTNCKRKHVGTYFYDCPDSDTAHTVHCTGRKETIVSKCPRRSRMPTCQLTDTTSPTACSVVEEQTTSDYTTCVCVLCDSRRRSERRRLSSDGSDSEEVELMSMSEYVISDFTNTMNEADSFSDPQMLASTWRLLLLFAAIWIGMPLSVWLHSLKTKKRNRATTVTPSKDIGGASNQEDISDVLAKFIKYATSVLPPLYDPSKTTIDKIQNEILDNHDYAVPFLVTNPVEKAIKTGYIVSVLTMHAFVLIVLFDLQYPSDNGECEALLTEDNCIAKKSPISSDLNQCYWDPEYTECHFKENTPTFEAFVWILILMAIMVVPLQFLLDLIFLRVLMAPTATDLDTHEQLSMLQVFRKMSTSVAAGARRASSVAMSAGSRVSTWARRVSSMVMGKDSKLLKRATLTPSESVASYVDAHVSLANSPLAMAQLTHARKKFVQRGGDTPAYGDKGKVKDNTLVKKDARTRNAAIDEDFKVLTDELHTHYNRGWWSKWFGSSSGLQSHQLQKNTIKSLAEKESQRFRTALLTHRNNIKFAEDVVEFDEMWKLTMIRANANTTMQNRSGTRYYFGTKAEEVMKTKMEETVRDTVLKRKEVRDLAASLRGPELLRLFILDVLGRNTQVAQVMKHKLYKDVEHFVVSWTMKCLAVSAVFMMNLYFLFTILLYAGTKGYEWQTAWMFTFMINIIVDVLFTSVIVAFVIHYWIPDHVSGKAANIRNILLDVVHNIFDNKNFNDQNKFKFSSTDYYFVSSRVAADHPELSESVLLSAYRNPLPGVMQEQWLKDNETEEAAVIIEGVDPRHAAYRRRAFWHKMYHFTKNSFRRLASNTAGMVIAIGTLPLVTQKIVIQTVNPLILSGLVMVGYLATRTTTSAYISCLVLTMTVVVVTVRSYYKTSEEKKNMKNQIKPVNAGKFNNINNSEKSGGRGRKSGISYLNMEDMLSDLGSIRDPNDDEDGSEGTISSVTSSSSASSDSSSESSVSIKTDDITISSGTNMDDITIATEDISLSTDSSDESRYSVVLKRVVQSKKESQEKRRETFNTLLQSITNKTKIGKDEKNIEHLVPQQALAAAKHTRKKGRKEEQHTEEEEDSGSTNTFSDDSDEFDYQVPIAFTTSGEAAKKLRELDGVELLSSFAEQVEEEDAATAAARHLSKHLSGRSGTVDTELTKVSPYLKTVNQRQAPPPKPEKPAGRKSSAQQITDTLPVMPLSSVIRETEQSDSLPSVRSPIKKSAPLVELGLRSSVGKGRSSGLSSVDALLSTTRDTNQVSEFLSRKKNTGDSGAYKGKTMEKEDEVSPPSSTAAVSSFLSKRKENK